MTESELERRVRALEDKDAVRSLVYGYASALDESRWQDYEACFTHDAHLEYSWGTVDGTEGLGDRVGEMLAGVTYMQHAITNLEVELDGDVGRGRADFIVTLVDGNHPDKRYWQELGYYRHEYRRTPDGWRFSRLECVSELRTRGAERQARPVREETRAGG